MGITIDYLAAGCGGVYSQRELARNRAQYVNPELTPEEVEANEADQKRLREILAGVTLTISPEAEEYMAAARERKEEERLRYEQHMQETNPLTMEDPFSQPGTEFHIISDALNRMGFYDNLSDEEVLEVETILATITYGMNSTVGTAGIVNDDQSTELTSYAARFELESSTAALRRFAEKYLPENMRDDFDTLVDKYYAHNSKALEGYTSSRERSIKAVAHTIETHGSKRVLPVTEDEKLIQLAAKVKVNDEDINNAVKGWTEAFKELANSEKSVDDAIDMMKDILNRLASGNSENKRFIEYIDEWNSFAIENAKTYWTALM